LAIVRIFATDSAALADVTDTLALAERVRAATLSAAC